MKQIMKKLAISAMAVVMVGMMSVTNSYANDDTVKPLAKETGTVLYRYNMHKEDSMEVKLHNGIDILYPDTTFINTPISGKVVDTGTTATGDYVIVTSTEHGDSILIANLKASFVEKGDTLNAGDEIGVAEGDYIHVGLYPDGYENKDITSDPTVFLTTSGNKLNFDVVNMPYLK